MPSWRPSWPEPRTWFITVRALEVAAVFVLVGNVLALRIGWQQIDQYGPTGPDGTPIKLTFWRHVSALALSGFLGVYGSSTQLVVGALLVLAPVVVLHRVRPVDNARVLRWEVLVVGAATGLLSLGTTLMWVVAMVRPNPYDTGSTDPDTVTVDQGPSMVETGLANLGIPLTSLLLVAIAALWWTRLPSEFEEVPQAAVDGASPRHKRSWRPAPAPDADAEDILLDGVEQIEPVERLRPRDAGGDGSTGSGYDDWFRRF